MPVLLDTCVLIDLLRKEPRARAAVSAYREQPKFCAVSTMELYAGARAQKEEHRIASLLSAFERIAMPDEVFTRAGSLLRHYRASNSLDFADALIAATAEHHGLELATLNVKHFPMFARLKAPY